MKVKLLKHIIRLKLELDYIRSEVFSESLFSGPDLLDWLAWVLGVERRPVPIPIRFEEPGRRAGKKPQRRQR